MAIVAAWSSIAASRIDCRDIIKSVETESSTVQTRYELYWSGMLLLEGLIVGETTDYISRIC